MVRIEQQPHVFSISQTKGLTVSLLLSDDVLALPVQEVQVVCNHPLLAFMDDFGVGAGVKILTTSHLLIFQPSQNLKEHKQEPVFFFWAGGVGVKCSLLQTRCVQKAAGAHKADQITH